MTDKETGGPVRFTRAAGSLFVAALVVGTVAASGSGVAWANGNGGSFQGNHGHRGGPATLFVSPSGQTGNSDWSCNSAAYSTIGAAVSAASPWATVVVCGGTYNEQVVLSQPLTLEGRGDAVIDETGVTPTFSVPMPPGPAVTIYAGVVIVSSNVTIEDLTITGAMGEGVIAAGLAAPITHVNINDNQVVDNDLGGGVPAASPYFECAAQGPEPGDCGEGVHLTGVAWSDVSGNYVSGNSGGILVSDDTGPTHDNVIQDNTVTKNLSDCGITLPGHNPNALDASGNPQPSVAGVYNNIIRDNRVTDNGTTGEGAGVLFANASAGTAVYDNWVVGNYIAGNGLSGVTMHAHTLAPGQFEDLSGNNVVGNWIGTNNVDGDTLDSPPPPAPAGTEDLVTTAVLVFSGGAPVTLRISDNHIFGDTDGIWLSMPVTAHGLNDNSFHDVVTPVSANN
jgi:nitrous oxidase accessory protein NosD